MDGCSRLGGETRCVCNTHPCLTLYPLSPVPDALTLFQLPLTSQPPCMCAYTTPSSMNA